MRISKGKPGLCFKNKQGEFPGGPVIRTTLSLPRVPVGPLVSELRYTLFWRDQKKKKKKKGRSVPGRRQIETANVAELGRGG